MHIDATPEHAINSFDPDSALGSSIDVLSHDGIDKVYTPHIIQEALSELLIGRTSFIIAHRLSTVRQCDRICVIEDGSVVESGTHAELMERTGGTYRRLAERQFAAAS